MAGTLALDVGTRRTGVAFLDPRVGFPVPLDTIVHNDFTQLRDRVLSLAAERETTDIVVGLPLLPSGQEGSQADAVRSFADMLEAAGLAVRFRDERYTTPKGGQGDGDASAACALLAG